jgi:hypothetical protein
MADENTGQPTPDAAVNNTGSADDKPSSGTQTGNTEDEPKTLTQSEFNRALQKRLKDEKDRQDKERKQADLTEIEKAKAAEAKAAELQRKLDLRDAKEEVVAAARKAGMKATASNDRLWRLVKDDIELDEKTGKATNVKDLVVLAKELDEDLFPKRPGGGDGGQGNGSPVGTSMNDMIRRSAGR